MDQKDISITTNGVPLKELTSIEYEERKGDLYPHMEYYHRRGDTYYFRDNSGRVLTMVTQEDLYKYIKYGQVIDMEIFADGKE